MLIGDHGIIKRAKEAGQNYEEAAKYEEEQLAKLYQMIENPDKYNPDEIIGETEKVIKDLQEQIDKLEQEKEDKENEIKQKDETIADLNQTIEDLRGQIEDLENEKKELIANNNALQEEIASKDAQIDDLNKQIGELQNTISNLQEEIANKNNEIEELKKQIAQQQETIRNFQEQINNLNSILSQTNATANQILTGKKAYSGGKLLTGTMPNRGAVTQTLNAGGSYTIPEGYHNGSGKVTAKDLASQTQATATASDIAQGKTAWVNGRKIDGTYVSTPRYEFPELTAYGKVCTGSADIFTEITLPISNCSVLSISSVTLPNVQDARVGLYIYLDEILVYSFDARTGTRVDNISIDISNHNMVRMKLGAWSCATSTIKNIAIY